MQPAGSQEHRGSRGDGNDVRGGEALDQEVRTSKSFGAAGTQGAWWNILDDDIQEVDKGHIMKRLGYSAKASFFMQMLGSCRWRI